MAYRGSLNVSQGDAWNEVQGCCGEFTKLPSLSVNEAVCTWIQTTTHAVVTTELNAQ